MKTVDAQLLFFSLFICIGDGLSRGRRRLDTSKTVNFLFSRRNKMDLFIPKNIGEHSMTRLEESQSVNDDIVRFFSLLEASLTKNNLAMERSLLADHIPCSSDKVKGILGKCRTKSKSQSIKAIHGLRALILKKKRKKQNDKKVDDKIPSHSILNLQYITEKPKVITISDTLEHSETIITIPTTTTESNSVEEEFLEEMFVVDDLTQTHTDTTNDVNQSGERGDTTLPYTDDLSEFILDTNNERKPTEEATEGSGEAVTEMFNVKDFMNEFEINNDGLSENSYKLFSKVDILEESHKDNLETTRSANKEENVTNKTETMISTDSCEEPLPTRNIFKAIFQALFPFIFGEQHSQSNKC